ncbi:MAG: hypothetical protein R3F19_06425 [Verrucomicrobiales bacterium]|nr:hypothetical protein [Verrucomicrobiae bacterium]
MERIENDGANKWRFGEMCVGADLPCSSRLLKMRRTLENAGNDSMAARRCAIKEEPAPGY